MCANPTTKVAQFNGSLDGFTGVDPVRYSNGLWLEQAATNYINNPVGATNTTSWSPQTNVTLTAESTLPGPLPDWLAGVVTTGFKITATANKSASSIAVSSQSAVAAAGSHLVAAYIWVPSAFSATSVGVRVANFTSASETEEMIDLSKRDQWQRVGASCVVDSGDLLGSFRMRIISGTMLSGETIWFTLAEIVPGTYLTSPVAETLGAGYANVGTAHNSASTRAASSASISPAGILSPDTGSLAFRFRRLIDTGGTETLLECGTAGSGTDYLSVAVNTSDKLVVSWNSDNAGAQTVTSTDSIAVDTEYFVYTDWNSTDINLRVNATTDTATRNAVQDDFGAGDLTLEASAGGAIFNGFAAYDRPLTDYEQSRLYAQPVWGLQTLVRSNKFNTFQLRPIGA